MSQGLGAQSIRWKKERSSIRWVSIGLLTEVPGSSDSGAHCRAARQDLAKQS